MTLDSRLFAIGAALATMLATYALLAGWALLGDWRRRRSVERLLADLGSPRVNTGSGTSVLESDEHDSYLRGLIA